ncbi:MAG: Txe/YoeB family addiction module toxin [Rikenellaceae bacterium]|jgi:toxin YoeB|nr:Txe/YoeB family addiction module toxin [Rikenellaceae bacterium]
MNYKLEITDLAKIHLARHNKSGYKGLVKKIHALLAEIVEHPRTGTGHPEALRHKDTEMWSRRIDAKHRLIYEIRDNELVVIAISAFGHYDDK